MSEMICGKCDGEGAHGMEMQRNCIQCNGTGKVFVYKPFRQDLILVTVLERLLSFAKQEQFSPDDCVRAYTITLPANEAEKLGVRENYITRFLTPKAGSMRLMLHHIHRADTDRHLHNHPWKEATSVILNGGYVEDRLTHRAPPRDLVKVNTYAPGDINHLRNFNYHKITSVLEDTWTLFINDTRLPEGWGFLIDGEHVPRKSDHTGKEES